MARDGVRAARAAGLSSRAKLDRKLASDAQFREHYQSSTAFRHGVESVLFDAAARRRSDKS
jgi:hypothetical protein